MRPKASWSSRKFTSTCIWTAISCRMSGYSARNAVMGSTRVARLAGK